MAGKRFIVRMVLENIGPHHGTNSISFSDDVNSNKLVFFATNGTGKSFISRAFRLCSNSAPNSNADKILTIGENEGHFSLSICTENSNRKLDLIVKRGESPVVDNSTDLLFHVFNSDYVEENLKEKNYTPDGKIEGYILGKAQIELTEERKKAQALKNEIDEDINEIDALIDEAKSFLKENGVVSTTTEFLAITRQNVENGFEYDITESVDECIQRIKTLEAIPEDLSDIIFSYKPFDILFLNKLESILKTVFPKSEWDDEFVREYKSQQHFIETGLDYSQAEKICPFCKQEYNSDALDLINKYKKYRNNQEARVIGQLQELLRSVDSMTSRLDEENECIEKAELQLIQVRKFFPSLAGLKMEKIAGAELYKNLFGSLYDMTSKKMDNLGLSLENEKKTVGECIKAWQDILELQRNNQQVVDTANKKKNDTKAERLLLRKNLCKAKSVALHRELSNSFKSINEKNAKLNALQEEIIRKEQQVRVSKRDKVYETLESLLARFFNGKYKIDKESFQIEFLGNNVGENASSILSDGEKSIVAFCWYLAETHVIVNSEEDYNKLFFVIDDPISSMDFHFVYAVAQAIRDIKSTFKISGFERIWVLTHNIEFFSIMMRNHILVHEYLMKPGLIEKFNHKLLLPYENHLFDLMQIATGNKTPDHTTGNSIRHVIETIANFEDPQIGLETYVNSKDTLSRDSYIFSLCQDLSHGNVRLEPPYSDEVLIEAAKIVVNYVNTCYPGQLKNVQL